MSNETVIKCLCCHETFDGIRELNRHRAGSGRDEGEVWKAAPSGWSHK